MKTAALNILTRADWVSPKALAERLDISVATMRRNIHTAPTPAPAGKLPGIRIGRQLRVHVDDILRFEARERRAATAKAMRAGRQRARSSAARVKDYFPNL